MILIHRSTRRRKRRGGALVAALVIVFALAGMAVAVFSLSLARSREANAVGSQIRALYMADSGITQALSDVAVNVRANKAVPPTIGTEALPVELSDGQFWCSVSDNGNGSFTVTSNGRSNSSLRAVQAVIVPIGDNWYDHALHAGNSSNDPTYTMALGGEGASADEITGDIYSGGDLDLGGSAAVLGELYANGSIAGGAGEEGVSHPTPDIAAMAYDVNHDVNVAAEFTASGAWGSGTMSGNAWELPEGNPAHIFRKNPDDRASEVNGTTKDDFFIEDPYESSNGYSSWYSGSGGHYVTIDDSGGAKDGNNKTYFIDGNLWIHSPKYMGMMFKTENGSPVKITFVVKGNVYYSDDLTVGDTQTEAVGIIAIKDPLVPDSGNIYMGDPRYGTLERVEAFMYAENNYHDLNLSGSGSAHVTVLGNMTAGNHVDIQRDVVQADGSVVHSKLSVQFDDRLSKGQIQLPGIPLPSANLEGFAVAMWREVTLDEEEQLAISQKIQQGTY